MNIVTISGEIIGIVSLLLWLIFNIQGYIDYRREKIWNRLERYTMILCAMSVAIALLGFLIQSYGKH
jgi:hypothetical protein